MATPKPPKKLTESDVISQFAKQRGISYAAMAREMNILSNHLIYVKNGYRPASITLVGRAFLAYGNCEFTRNLAEVVREHEQVQRVNIS